MQSVSRTSPQKTLIKSSGYRTRPMKASRYRPRLTQIGENRKVLQFGVDGANQTKEGIQGLKPASKKLLGRYA